MFQFFRNFFKTKLGLAIALAFLGLIALAFASADVSSTGTFGGIAGGDRVAVVGDEKISTADLIQGANNGLDRVRQDQPTATMQAFLRGGGLDSALEALISRAVFYDLVAVGETVDALFGVWSENVFFPIAPAADIQAWLEDDA